MDRLEEVKKANKNIADFIVNVDGDGKICLLPYNEFLKKYFGFKEEEKTRLLFEFEELLETGKVSPDYLLKEWNKNEFERLIHSKKKNINATVVLEAKLNFSIKIRNKFDSIIKSNISLNKKIISLSQLIKDYIQFYGKKQFDDDLLYNDLESELNHLKEMQAQEQLEQEREKFELVDSENEFKRHETQIDYSNNSKTERIVFLHELGILDFMQKKMIKELHGFSINKLAEIISTFTDIDQKTAQSYLNPMFTKDAIQKNNPLTKSNLEKVKTKLNNIGFNTSKTA